VRRDNATWATLGATLLGLGAATDVALVLAAAQVAEGNLWGREWFLALFAFFSVTALAGAYIMAALVVDLPLPTTSGERRGAIRASSPETIARQQIEWGELKHRGDGYAAHLAEIRERGIDDFTRLEAASIAEDVDAWFDESFEWVVRERRELSTYLTKIPTPTRPNAIDVIPPLLARRLDEMTAVAHRLG
jgi:hypothetical protein